MTPLRTILLFSWRLRVDILYSASLVLYEGYPTQRWTDINNGSESCYVLKFSTRFATSLGRGAQRRVPVVRRRQRNSTPLSIWNFTINHSFVLDNIFRAAAVRLRKALRTCARRRHDRNCVQQYLFAYK